MRNLYAFIIALFCLITMTGCGNNKPLNYKTNHEYPSRRYVDRNESDAIEGTVIDYQDGDDTILFTTNLRGGEEIDTIISPLKNVDMASLHLAIKARDGDKTPIKVIAQYNSIYQNISDTIGNTYFMERCGCPHKALQFH